MVARQVRANALRMLSVDAVEQAKSGHPGMPLGMADIAEVLWHDYLQHNPNNPGWLNRDRFVLSNGHGSMLLYALLHLSGYDLTLEDLKQFRQWQSKTPGHPEHDMTPGVETTTGPLGQGLANAVGMAIAERRLAARFNRDNFPIIDHRTYVFLGDGCLMEGLSHEVCSLASTLGLGKLIAIWDDNQISIDGRVEGWFTESVPQRFQAYGWQVIEAVDGHDAAAIAQALEAAQAETTRPSLIACRTQIGFGAPTVAGTERCHGAPLGAEEIAGLRKTLDWPHAAFVVPEAVRADWDACDRGAAQEAAWQALWQRYTDAHPELAKALSRQLAGALPGHFNEAADALIERMQQAAEAVATRKASQQCLQALAPLLPELVGGSADLTGSNLTAWSAAEPFAADHPAGNYVYYGVREFGMFAIMNGMALHGGVLPFAGTFLTFVDYGRNALRMAALMQQRVILVLTHDSIGLGEDGPTHQPVEHLSQLRSTPNVAVWRPADATETAVAWRQAIARDDGPTCLVLSRQSLPALPHTPKHLADMARGAYILRAADGEIDALLLATGSEVQIALAAAEQLAAAGLQVQVVSMPSTTQFDQQPKAYRDAVLPPAVKVRVAIEAGSTGFWRQYVGLVGDVVGLDQFGASAPADQLFAEFGFTAEQVALRVMACREQAVDLG